MSNVPNFNQAISVIPGGETTSSVEGSDVLEGLDGSPLSCDWLSAKLAAEFGVKITGIQVVPGTERRWPQSHSAKLHLSFDGTPLDTIHERLKVLFLKKVVAQYFPNKSLSALRRDLCSSRCEARFYSEFVPILRERGVPMPKCVLVDERLEVLDEPAAGKTEQEQKELLRSGGMLLLMESAEKYEMISPFNADQATCALRMLAQLHASAWEDRELLEKASDRLNKFGRSWSLEKRGFASLQDMNNVWSCYLKGFAPLAPKFLSRPDVVNLAERLKSLAPWIADELACDPKDPFTTLIHGDSKAANIFLPLDRTDGTALPIDFQWVGPGFGMTDVAMHLIHSVETGALTSDGEKWLVNVYLRTLKGLLPVEAAVAYTDEIAWRHYHLALLDYARCCLPGFPTDSSPEVFAQKNRAPRAINIGKIYKDPQASLHLVGQICRCLDMFERELNISTNVHHDVRSRSESQH